MDVIKRLVVEEAEVYLSNMESDMRVIETQLKDSEEDKKAFFRKLLEEARIKYSQAMASVVLYKAKYGIFTHPKSIK